MRSMTRKLHSIAAGLGLLAAIAAPAYARNHGISMNEQDSASQDCADHLKFRSWDHDAIVNGEEQQSMANAPLTITAAHNGGIHVRNWDQPTIEIKVCKAAAADNTQIAKAALDKIHLVKNGNSLRVEGPSQDDEANWAALILVFAPKNSKLDLSASNGGISLREVASEVNARTVNGGISLVGTTGKMQVQAENGGISLSDCGGDVDVTVQNGGVNVKLAKNWSSGHLTGSTLNGGMSVEVPSDFSGTMLVRGSEHSHISCRSEKCASGEKTWDDEGRVIKLGSGDPNIKLSTVNGGIVIRDRGHEDDSARMY